MGRGGQGETFRAVEDSILPIHSLQFACSLAISDCYPKAWAKKEEWEPLNQTNSLVDPPSVLHWKQKDSPLTRSSNMP